jgi:hypothetical protein
VNVEKLLLDEKGKIVVIPEGFSVFVDLQHGDKQ